MVKASAPGTKGHEFESRTKHFPKNQIIYSFISLSVIIISLNFEVKHCANIFESTTIQDLQSKRDKAFYFSKWLIPT